MPAKESKWRKSPPELIDTLHETVGAALADDAAVDLKPMFGYPCYWTGGNMFFATYQDHMILRLAEEDRAAFMTLPGAHQFEPMAGRPMREYVVVPSGLAGDRPALQDWVRRAYGYAVSLPPKEKKPRRKKG